MAEDARLLRSLTVASLTGGVLVRVWQYADEGSLWLDEIAVARNVVERSLGDLLSRPLDYAQAAPKGFLAAEKIATIVAGPGDYVFRFWPFLASVAALLLCWRLAVRVLRPVGVLVAVTCAAFAVSLIRQTSEVKQYGTDVVAALLLILLTLSERRDRRFDIAAGLSGAAAVWFSQPAVIVAGCMVLVLAWMSWRHRAEGGLHTTGIWRLTLWPLSAAAAALVAMQGLTPEVNDYMHRYWASGFPPATMSDIARTAWPWAPLVELFGGGARGFSTSLGYPWPGVYVALCLLGLAALIRRTPVAGVTLALPVVATIAAAVLQQYPFKDRVILFLLPIFFCGLGEIASEAHRLSGRVRMEAGAIAVALLTAGTVYPVLRVVPPYTMEDVHPIMAALAADRANEPAIFLHYNAGVAFEFYARRYGFGPGSYSVASCRSQPPSAALRQLDTMRGRPRVWVVFVHVTSGVALERTDLLAYLDTIGHRREHILVPGRQAVGDLLPSEAYLYDLSDPHLLARATADRFPLKSTFDRGRNCDEGPQTMTVATLAHIR